MLRSRRSLVTAVVAIAVTACGQPELDPANSTKMWIAAPGELQQMAAALSKAQIRFEVRKGAANGSEIWYDIQSEEQVLRISDELFGVPPPNGRNMGLSPEDTAVFVEQMRSLGAAFRTGTFHGGSYVAWDAESDAAADAVLAKLGIGPEMLAEQRRIRERVDAEQASQTGRPGRSGEERTP